MKSLKSFLMEEILQETKGDGVLDAEEWSALTKIGRGRLSNELKDILGISKAAELKLGKVKGARCNKDPAGLLKDLNIKKQTGFQQMINAISKSNGKLGDMFSGKVGFLKDSEGNDIAKIQLSTEGDSVVKSRSGNIRFFKFWIDSVAISMFGKGADAKLEYRKSGSIILVRDNK